MALYKVPAAGGTPTLVYDPDGSGYSDAENPVLSPDGTQLLFLDRNATDLNNQTVSLATIGVDGSRLQLLKTATVNANESLGSYAWSPDGTKIAYTWQVYPNPTQIYVYDLASGNSTQLTSESGSCCTGDEFPAWSPDGTKIAYFHWQAPSATQTIQLDVVPATGGTATTLYSYSCSLCGSSYTMGPEAWLPDGTKIAFGFTIPPSNNDDIYTVNADGSSNGSPARLAGSANDEWWPAWSVDGSKLVVTLSDANDNYLEKLYAIDAATGAETQLTDGGSDNSLLGDYYPTW
jgi:TolB protein